MSRRWSVVMAAVSLALGINGAVHLVWFDVASLGPLHQLVDIASLGAPVAGTAYGSWLIRDRDPELSRRVVAWTLSGGAAAALLAMLALYTGSVNVLRVELAHALQLAVPAGAVVGVLVGLREAQFVEAARDAERARTRAASLAREQRTLERLNAALRHHVLNGANVIAGNAELLREQVDENGADVDVEAACDRLDAVHERASQMATTVDRVRMLIHTATDEPDTRPVDGVSVLEREVTWARREYPEADIETDLPESARVKGDELLSEAFHELLANALEHGGERPTVRVDIERNGERVSVRVSDDGEGIADEKPFDLTEQGDDGLGLYLVESVVERYGDVTVEEAGDGTTVRVDLQAA